MGDQVARIKQMMVDHVISVTKAVTYHVDAALFSDTPVDTTNAQNNWRASVGGPRSGVVGSKKNPSVQGFLEGMREIAAFRFSHGMLWIVNNVHYITDLNRGYSPKAPPQFVQKAMRKGVRAALNLIRPVLPKSRRRSGSRRDRHHLYNRNPYRPRQPRAQHNKF